MNRKKPVRGTNDGVPKAVIFDLDGTLIRSSVDFAKFRSRLIEYMKERGADLSRYDLTGTTVDMIDEFERECGQRGLADGTVRAYLDDIDAVLDEIEMERISETLPVPEAPEVLKYLRAKGVLVGVLTRGCAGYARKAIDIAGLDGLVDAIVARDRKSGIAPKPDPQAAFRLLDMLGTEPEEAVMIGDFSLDFDCARDSGIRFYGIASNENSKKSLKECGCDEIVADLKDFLNRIGVR
ncbi:MAG TPA: HAD family hydrolase [Euryarchaeota archaeon]|nr:HAD family hydrolase [Euryarchaeota archaeon]